jgi:hypothetical protein
VADFDALIRQDGNAEAFTGRTMTQTEHSIARMAPIGRRKKAWPGYPQVRDKIGFDWPPTDLINGCLQQAHVMGDVYRHADSVGVRT